ncbi:unnamed protein product [Haemonchus placei]|uniref:Uncharacterized protein n=1 Tax=Haemonchus placei TaxID=6290 RepID=A0A0N4X305_HAEPC|nr:unnamed protein product [Haemonchus placei]
MRRGHSIFRIVREALKISCQLRYVGPAPRRILTAGFTSSLALSFFSSSSHPQVDESKPANFDIIVREADALYDSYLIDNAYSILKRLVSFSRSFYVFHVASRFYTI